MIAFTGKVASPCLWERMVWRKFSILGKSIAADSQAFASVSASVFSEAFLARLFI